MQHSNGIAEVPDSSIVTPTSNAPKNGIHSRGSRITRDSEPADSRKRKSATHAPYAIGKGRAPTQVQPPSSTKDTTPSVHYEDPLCGTQTGLSIQPKARKKLKRPASNAPVLEGVDLQDSVDCLMIQPTTGEDDQRSVIPAPTPTSSKLPLSLTPRQSSIAFVEQTLASLTNKPDSVEPTLHAADLESSDATLEALEPQSNADTRTTDGADDAEQRVFKPTIDSGQVRIDQSSDTASAKRKHKQKPPPAAKIRQGTIANIPEDLVIRSSELAKSFLNPTEDPAYDEDLTCNAFDSRVSLC
jgi:hypothetical protein